ncbi:hypothetical protein F5050DRAFT_1781488 [Lentinula boryana]|uniref:Uncharacterized protein n=1 Tax=Lentinula boryana TaxID=40481 RepID=A0ABQ8Q4E3_9AGAR|nr:hypothetical protein F5050DRAFT_1781488 [Lentinula boryana]
MVTRLPSHLDALVSPSPPSSQGLSESTLIRPWRGLFLVSGTRASDISSNVEIRVTGVETDGDIRCHLWPLHIVFSITVPHALPILPQLQNYIKNRLPPIPLTTFLPERLRDSNHNVINQTHFHSLSRMLWDGQLVAVVPISLPGSMTSVSFSQGTARHGMLIYPAANSTSLLIGAVFLTPEHTFPAFISSSYATTFGNTSSGIPSQRLASRYTAFPSEDTTSVPISPTVLHSQSRQESQHRVSPRPYSALRSPSVRISSSYRYSPVTVPPGTVQGHRLSFPQTHPSFAPAGATMASQGTAASMSYRTGNNSSPGHLSFGNPPIFNYPLIEPANYSAQSDLALEQLSNQPSSSHRTSIESSQLGYSERRSPGESNSSDDVQLHQAARSEQDLEKESAASIFNPFDLTTRTRSH